uniref:Uncharacterized protein n=1 Tax=Rhizophora mucronata TaxID=61149 RepID=A0A2P2NR60_RHIMU
MHYSLLVYGFMVQDFTTQASLHINYQYAFVVTGVFFSLFFLLMNRC